MKLSAGILEIDVHGMTKLQAVALIDARLSRQIGASTGCASYTAITEEHR